MLKKTLVNRSRKPYDCMRLRVSNWFLVNNPQNFGQFYLNRTKILGTSEPCWDVWFKYTLVLQSFKLFLIDLHNPYTFSTFIWRGPLWTTVIVNEVTTIVVFAGEQMLQHGISMCMNELTIPVHWMVPTRWPMLMGLIHSSDYLIRDSHILTVPCKKPLAWAFHRILQSPAFYRTICCVLVHAGLKPGERLVVLDWQTATESWQRKL